MKSGLREEINGSSRHSFYAFTRLKAFAEGSPAKAFFILIVTGGFVFMRGRPFRY